MAAFLFIFGAVLSLGASVLLVTRLERLGARFGAPEAMLGIAAALAADSPEIATAVTALARGQRDVVSACCWAPTCSTSPPFSA